MAKKKDKKKVEKKTDYKKKYKKLKVKYKKLKAKLSVKQKKGKSKKKVKEVINKFTDHSSNYNAKNAILKVREFTSIDNLNAFTKNEKRVTVVKATQGRLNRISK